MEIDAYTQFLKTSQAAAHLGLSPRGLERHRVTGAGPLFHRFGNRVLYLLSDVLAWAPARRRRLTSDGHPPEAQSERRFRSDRVEHADTSDTDADAGSAWHRYDEP